MEFCYSYSFVWKKHFRKTEVEMYNQKINTQTQEYVKKHQHRISLKIKNDVWDRISPVIKERNIPEATWIKEAIYEKMARENPGTFIFDKYKEAWSITPT